MSVATIKIISFSSQMITSFPCLRASQFWRQWQILFPPLLWIAPALGRYLAPEDGSPSGGELLEGKHWEDGKHPPVPHRLRTSISARDGADLDSQSRTLNRKRRERDQCVGGRLQWRLASLLSVDPDPWFSVWGTLEVDSLFVICGITSEGLRMSRHLVLTLALGQISLGEFLLFCPWGDIFQWHWHLKLPHNNNISYNVHIVLCQEGYR